MSAASAVHTPGHAHLPALVQAAVIAHGPRTALTEEVEGGGWRRTSYAEMGRRVDDIAAGLVRAGVGPRDRVAIFAANCASWTLVDLAILTVGAVPVPIYATNTDRQVAYILADSGAVLAFVKDADHLATVQHVRADCPALNVVVLLPDPSTDTLAATDLPDGARTLSDLERSANARRYTTIVQKRLRALRPSDLAVICYTSGTTGDPKGVMLTHANLLHQHRAISALFEFVAGEKNMCFLPLSHAFERGWTLALVLAHGLENVYVADPKAVGEAMRRIQPDTFVSVPRLFEKVYAAAQASAGSGIKRRLFDWALDVGRRYHQARAAGRVPSPDLLAQFLCADRLVLHAVRDAVGGRKRVMACGGAPLRREIEEFFFAAGLMVYQGYGITETSPVVSCNAPGAYRFGTVGRPVLDCRVRIAADGEILVHGGNVMTGYWHRPAETDLALRHGWFHTGDVGRLDDDGYLLITDRIKDLIVTANGKNVAPAPIESALQADPLVELAVVIGDGRPYLSALLQPSYPDLEAMARKLGLAFGSRAELLALPQVKAAFEAVVERVGAQAARHERIHRFHLMLGELSLESEDLTPTLKVKRRAVSEKYAAEIDAMYDARYDEWPDRSA